MIRILILFIFIFVSACGGQSKEELLQEGQRLLTDGNYRGAIVLFKNALEKDSEDLTARRGLAEANFKSGQFRQAESEYRKTLLQDPSDASVRLKLADIYLALKQPEKALLELDEFHSKNQETVESLTLNGRVYAGMQDFPSAENLFRKALALDGSAAQPRINLALIALHQRDPDQARIYLQKVLELDKNELQAYALLATVELREGHREAALQTYQELVDADPKAIQAMYMVGVLQMDLGRFAEAGSTVDAVLSAFPDRAEGARLKGILLYREGDYAAAKVVLENSLKKEEHLFGYFFLGLTYYGLEQYEQALNQFQKTLDLNPDFERGRTLVAMTLLKQQRIDDAIIEIQKVLRSNPENAYARNILGSAYLASGEYDKGLEELEKSTELDPNLTEAHIKRGLFLLSRGDGAAGEADLVKAVEAAPEVMNSRLMLANHYLRQKNYSAAVALLSEGKDGTKTDALLNNYLAAAYFAQKKPEMALSALQEATRINPDYLTPHFNIAAYFASRSEYDKALQEYRQILQKDPMNLKALLGSAAIFNVQGREVELEKTYRQVEATQSVQGYVAAAQYFLRKQDAAEALAIADRGVAVHDTSAALLELKGRLLITNQEFPEAEAVFKKLSEIAPEQGNRFLLQLYLSTGKVAQAQELVDSLLPSAAGKEYPYLLASAFKLGQNDQAGARAALEKGIAAIDGPVRLKLQLGRLFEEAGQLSEAERIYRELIASSPKFSPAYTALGYLSEKHGSKGEALEFYRKALTFDGNSISALNNAAYLLADNFGEVDEALAYALRAYRLEPNDPRIMDTLGYVLVKNDRAEDAEQLLLKASKLLADIPEVKLHLAMAKIGLGDKISARKLLNELSVGDGPVATEAQALIEKL